MDRAAYNIKKSVRDWFRELLELMFAAAALIIDTLRTFFLVVLSILGPIAFAFSVWDGFHSTLSAWFSRYIQIYLWLPADLPLASRVRPVQHHTGENPDSDAPAGHRAYADRPELLAGRERRGVHRVPYHRHRGLFAASAATTRTSGPPGLWAAAWQVQPQETWWGVPESSSRERLERCSRGNSRNGRSGTLGLPMCHSDLSEVSLREKDTEI